ncbi:MAG: hypothetical protein GY832_46010 [Chloroflexi bacterium]|jgi:hypothetical protein|uniref:sulfotransferase family protein n=1 Tax=Paracoccus marcusii TaxID=59779 RepID=UPI001C3DEC84|nr:hypothetical protein [Paracoccus marcusii]MCP4544519.1 hypothetical protein [Chloroflexota bacterium]QXI66153.1 hypothetical protein CP157_03945 [Paracoccus marcusii]
MGTLNIISGMDRSGTSLCAAISQFVGVHLGNNLIGPRDANPKGYFEDRRGVSINEQLLRHNNYGRKLASPLPNGWETGIPAKLAEIRIRKVLNDLSRNNSLFGIKDPRLCITSKLWDAGAKSLNHDVRYTMCIRNPIEVSASLNKRDGTDKASACLMWMAHTMTFLRSSHGSERLWVDYAKLMADPLETAASIKFFVQGIEKLTNEEMENISGFVDVRLWRNRSESTANNYIEEAALQLYECIKSKDQELLTKFLDNGPGLLIEKLSHHAALSLSKWVPPYHDIVIGEDS